MRNRFVFCVVAFAFTTLASCKKDTIAGNTAYEVKAKIGGNWVNFKNAVSYLHPNETMAGKTDFSVSATSADGLDFFSVYVETSGTLDTGTYDSQGFPDPYIIVDYMKNNGQPDEKDFTLSTIPGLPPARYIVTITEITDTEIR